MIILNCNESNQPNAKPRQKAIVYLLHSGLSPAWGYCTNFGAIARTAECAGVHTILIPEQNSAALNADAVKTSSGALHKIPISRTWNLKLSLQLIKDSGIQIISCTEKTQNQIYQADFKTPTAIILGSEEDGISSEFLKMSDKKVKIPIRGKISSLNVSVAAGIITYEAIRQRNI